MRIKSIEIDGFGVWNGLTLEDLTSGTTVVYGRNEAGKTTLMQFIRAILYGFTLERRARYLPPVNGGKPGGRLQVANEFGSFVLHRTRALDDSPENLGTLNIVDDRGENRDQVQLEALLAGVDEPTYNNVFNIGLREIQELGSLDDTAAADYLYRLTSGLDRVSLVEVIREVGTARQRLLADDEGTASQIPQLVARREKLQGRILELSRQTKRFHELAVQRTNLVNEIQQLDEQILQIDNASHVLRAALDVQGPWNLRDDSQRQLAVLKDVKQLPDRSVEKLEAINLRLTAGRKRLKKLLSSRTRLKRDLASLEVNKVLLGHAGRIESLHDQSQWILGLVGQVDKLRGEVKKLDADIDAAITGYRGAGGSLDELPRETVAVLRRPGQVIREESEKLDKAKQEADEAKRALDAAVAQYEQVSRSKHLTDLNQSIQETGTRVSLLRKRIQGEERIDQLSRRRQELEVDSGDLGASEEAPLRISALLGLFFSLGVMLVLIGIFGGMYNWVGSSWVYVMFGIATTGGSMLGKLLLEKTSDQNVSDSFRQLEQLRVQLADAKRERDEIDAELPTSSGSLDACLREAEIELRDLERLIPIRTEREQAEQRHQASQRQVAGIQEAMKEARQKWKSALRSVGLPEDFAPPKVKQVVKNNEQVLELRRRRDARKDELDQRERELLVINNRLQQIIDDVRLPCASDQPIVRVRELIQAVVKEKETVTLREDVEKRLRKVLRTRDKIGASLRKASRHKNALFTLAGVEDEKGFRQAAANWTRVVELKRQIAEMTLRIQSSLTGPHSEDAVAGVFHTEGRDIKKRWDERQRELAEHRGKLAQMHERRGACTHEMQSLAADRQIGRAQLEIGAVQVQIDDALRRWKILTVVARLLEIVRNRFETDRQPETLREASQYLTRLTDGHYTRVWMPLDKRGLLVENDEKQSLSLDVLSRGTREAVFIGLRLALVGSFARRGATLPLVLDDVLVNFDTDRVRCAAEVLCEFARRGHQVIMFTCHEHITDIMEDAKADVRVLPRRDGNPVVRKKRTVELELPPPLPLTPAIETMPVRLPPIDPNPLFQMAAAEAPEFDPVYPLPDPPELPKLPDFWPLADSLVQVARRPKKSPPTPPVTLPDSWPVAELPKPKLRPTPPVPVAAPRMLPETVSYSTSFQADSFEVLAYRQSSDDAVAIAELPLISAAQQPGSIVVISPPEKTPPAPKHLSKKQLAQRFAWESPEMYREE